jgi:hypothetical protein
MVTERIAQVCSTRYKGQAAVLHITYRLRHLLNRHLFQVGRRRSSEQLPCERSSSLENDKGLESSPALEAQLLFFEPVRYPRLAQSLADCAMDKRNTAWIKTTLWPCYDQPAPSFLHPSYSTGLPEKFVKWSRKLVCRKTLKPVPRNRGFASWQISGDNLASFRFPLRLSLFVRSAT